MVEGFLYEIDERRSTIELKGVFYLNKQVNGQCNGKIYYRIERLKRHRDVVKQYTLVKIYYRIESRDQFSIIEYEYLAGRSTIELKVA